MPSLLSTPISGIHICWNYKVFFQSRQSYQKIDLQYLNASSEEKSFWGCFFPGPLAFFWTILRQQYDIIFF